MTPRRYVVWAYWAAVVLIGVSGTMAADVPHVGPGVPYSDSAAGFAVALVAIFATWSARERTLSIPGVTTRRRELFYWSTVVTTFALGTAVGDPTAVTVDLGYLASGLLFAALILIPALAYRRGWPGGIAGFRAAYILTRPLGASFADRAGAPPERGGLDLGIGPVSLVLPALIAGGVGYLAATRGDAPDRADQEMAGREGGGHGAIPGTARERSRASRILIRSHEQR